MNDLYIHQLETENRQLRDKIKILQIIEKEYTPLLHENNELQQKINKAKELNQYIIDYGFDYDGFNDVENLKGLIDMMVDYARQVRRTLNDTTE